MYEGETEPIPRVTDRGEPDVRDRPGPSVHHHDHGPPPPASRRVRTLVAALLIPFALAAAVGTILLFPFGDGPQTQGGAGRPVHGVITATQSGSCTGQVQVGEQPDEPQCLVVKVLMTDGEAPGTEISVIVPQEPSTPRFAVDDEVVLSYGGSDPRQSGSYQLVDFQRDVPLALLAGLFAVAVLVLGRWQGLKALVALGLSFLVLVFFVLPAILAGESPLLVAICGAGVILFVVLYLTHGFSARTSTAVLGTMVSLAMIGVLGALWAAFAKLTGLDEETATLVGLLNAPIDTRGLLLAGVVIGALGVLDDVTVTQTSAVWELRAANPLLTRRELYTSALRIGRDHVASAVNTLVMAYAGAALPLLLYSSISGVGLGSILTSQSIAQEVVRTLVGSIGLVAAVPITTALAAAVAAQEPAPQPARQRGPAARSQAGRRSSDERRTESGADRPARDQDRALAGTALGDDRPRRPGGNGRDAGGRTRRAGAGEGRHDGHEDLAVGRRRGAGDESARSDERVARTHGPDGSGSRGNRAGGAGRPSEEPADERAARAHAGDRQAGTRAGDRLAGARAADRQAGTRAGDRQAGTRAADRQAGTRAGDRLAGARAADRQAGTRAADRQAGTGTRAANVQPGEPAPTAHTASNERGATPRGLPAPVGTHDSRHHEGPDRPHRTGNAPQDQPIPQDTSESGGYPPDPSRRRRANETSPGRAQRPPHSAGPSTDQRAWFDDDLDD